jgi:PTS system nitrogen regulatory IIA component
LRHSNCSGICAAVRITEFLKLDAVVSQLAAKTKSDVLAELAASVSRVTPSVPFSRIHEVLSEREKIGSTGMEKGVAIPHGRLSELADLVACFGVSKQGIDFDARDGRPSHFFFALVAPENSAGVHLKALSKVSRLFRSDTLRDAILAANTREEIYALIAQEDARA